MYQPALLSSPAKLLLGCISIAISQSNTILFLIQRPHIPSVSLPLPTNSISPCAASSLLYLKGTRNNLNKEKGASCNEDRGLIAALVVLRVQLLVSPLMHATGSFCQG